MGRKHYGKRRNSSFRAIAPFPSVFFLRTFTADKNKTEIVWERVRDPGALYYLFTKQQFFYQTKLKAFAVIMISVFDRTKNIVEKGENARCQHFLLFPTCFQKQLKIVRSQDCVVLSYFEGFVKTSSPFPKQQILLFQTERVWRRQFQI